MTLCAFQVDWSKYDGQLAALRRELIARHSEYESWCAPGDVDATLAADRRLVGDGILNEAELLALYCECLGTVPPEEEELQPATENPGIALEYMNANLCLPLESSPESLTLLVCEPYHLSEHYFNLRRNRGGECEFVFCRRTLLERLLSRYSEEPDSGEGVADPGDEEALRSMAGEARVVRLVNDIFNRAIELGASDIHVEPGEEAVSVRCRVDGVLTEILSCPLNQFPAISSRIKLIAGLNIAESRLPQDGRTTFQLGRMELDMRVSTIPILTGESIVLRLLNKDAIRFDLKALGMSQGHLTQFRELITIPHGMILVVGPTGSGKTTTLYSIIAQLNNQEKKIITVEDPVEYQTPGLCQMQVNSKIGVTFANGLRSIVRQDPDIILVGEIRDRETADIAINAALTGHLVLSTLHTNDAVGAVTRLVDMGVEPFLVASALYGVLSQRLVRKVCRVCHGTGEDAAQPNGRCRHCNGTGFKGRCGIFELLRVNDEMRRAINRNLPSSEIEKLAVANGMVTLLEDGRAKVAAGVTTAEELARSTAEM